MLSLWQFNLFMFLLSLNLEEVSCIPGDVAMTFTLLHKGEEQIIFFNLKLKFLFAVSLSLSKVTQKYNDDCMG